MTSVPHSGAKSVTPGGSVAGGHTADLPAPRLQLRWERMAEPHEMDWAGERSWRCHYELVLPLGEYDIRREVYEDGEQVGERSELICPIKGPTVRRSNGAIPCLDRDGDHYYDSPIRDGAHAKWDAEVLGGLPIYVIAPDGTPLIAKATAGETRNAEGAL